MERIIALNFKAYSESAGEYGVRLAMAVEEVAAERKSIEFIACPQAPELHLLAKRLRHASVFAQHADALGAGAHTGWLPPQSVKASGCAGTLVNHSERRLAREQVQAVVGACSEISLRAMVCAEDLGKALEYAFLKPWAVAYEPPELIGSGISVSTAQPEIVEDFVKKIRRQTPEVVAIVGAGVTTPEDVGKCFELGAQGVLIASAFVKASDPRKLLEEIAEAI